MKKETQAKRLTLEDLDLEIEAQDQVKGGWGTWSTTVELDWSSDLGDLDDSLDNTFVFGDRPDCGAGDAVAWNEGDITLSEAK